ncbi:MAG: hypothetical protein ABFD81_03625 [Syntrophaceae bacterium]
MSNDNQKAYIWDETTKKPLIIGEAVPGTGYADPAWKIKKLYWSEGADRFLLGLNFANGDSGFVHRWLDALNDDLDFPPVPPDAYAE